MNQVCLQGFKAQAPLAQSTEGGQAEQVHSLDGLSSGPCVNVVPKQFKLVPQPSLGQFQTVSS